MGHAPGTPLPHRIEQIKAEIATLGALRPGTLTRQYNVCGTPELPVQGRSRSPPRPVLPAQLHLARQKPQ